MTESDQAQAPKADRAARQSDVRRLTQERQHVPRPERDQPRALFVVADGKHDGVVRGERLLAGERRVVDVPCAAAHDRLETLRRVLLAPSRARR